MIYNTIAAVNELKEIYLIYMDIEKLFHNVDEKLTIRLPPFISTYVFVALPRAQNISDLNYIELTFIKQL